MSHKKRGERGASLVEFALTAPFLILLLLGIIEFGWAFNQNLDVRHGARETARLVDVNRRYHAAKDPACTTWERYSIPARDPDGTRTRVCDCPDLRARNHFR